MVAGFLFCYYVECFCASSNGWVYKSKAEASIGSNMYRNQTSPRKATHVLVAHKEVVDITSLNESNRETSSSRRSHIPVTRIYLVHPYYKCH